jgi:hypothetical protein
MSIYGSIKRSYDEGKIHFSHMVFPSLVLEKCLSDTPIYETDLNTHLSYLYVVLQTHNNKINVTRLEVNENYKREMLKDILDDYDRNKAIWDYLRKRIIKYEENIKL